MIDIHKDRWPAAKRAFELELQMAQNYSRAEQAYYVDPTEENDRARQEANAALSRARRAYSVACDEDERNWVKKQWREGKDVVRCFADD